MTLKPKILIAIIGSPFFALPSQVLAQEHACESDNVATRGGEHAYRRDCCAVRPYSSLAAVAREQGIGIRSRGTAQEPQPGYFLCTVEFAWEPQWDDWRRDPANFSECVGRVRAVIAEQKSSAPGIFYTPHDLRCGDNLDRYLCALGNRWACK